MLNSVIFIYIYIERGGKGSRGKLAMLAWHSGTPVHIPTVNGQSPPVAFRGLFGKLSTCMGAAWGNAAVKRLGEQGYLH